MKNVRLGSFRLVEPLGSGGMASVWRGVYEGPGADRLPETHRGQVALKVLTSTRARQQDWRDAFASEVRAVARLHHPNILAVYDFGEVPEEAEMASFGQFVAGSPWLAMEVADAGSLGGLAQGMSWRDLRHELISLMQALAHAHAGGLVHRDLKPANILFGRGGALKLADFGLVVDLRGSSSAPFEEFIVGTPNYMAPEQFEARVSDYGPWTDLYALGCMVYRLVCGRPAYPVHGFRALHEAHSTWPVPTLNPSMGVPEGLGRWVQTLMAKDPYHRFLTVADALVAMDSLGPVVGEGVSVGIESVATTTTDQPPDRSARQTVVDSNPVYDWPRPGFATDWRGAVLRSRSDFRGVGLGLHGVRTLPFTGREDLRDRLWDRLRQVYDQRTPRAVVLDGPGGVGKSRVVRWVAERAQELGVGQMMVANHSLDGDARMGLLPTLQHALGLRDLSVRSAEDLLLRRWGLDEQSAVVLAQGLVNGVASEGERRGLWRRALEVLAARPAIVLLEDVAWGLESAQFVRWFLEQPPVPVLFLLTVRTEDLGEAAAVYEELGEICSDEWGSRETVAPLEDEEASQLVIEGLGLRGDLAAQVLARTAGNPLFAVQLVGDWVTRGILEPDAEGFHLAPGARVQLPDDLHAIWNARIDALMEGRSREDAEALELAAVLGTTIDPSDWRRVCAARGLTRGRVREALLEAGLAQQEPGEVRWSFVHGMARETLLRRTREGGRWAQAHRACAEVLRGAGQESRLGRHLLEAGQAEDALQPLRKGIADHIARGELAQAQVAVELQRRALQGMHGDEVMWAHLQRARLARLGGRILAAEGELDGAGGLAEALGNLVGQAHVWCERALVAYRAGRLDEVMSASEEGAQRAERAGEVLLLARCREVRARALTDQAQFDAAQQAYLCARESFAAEGDEGSVATCDLGLGWVALSRHAYPEAQTQIEAALERLTRLGARSTIATAHNLLGEVSRALGDTSASATHYRRALGMHQACGSQGGATIAQLNLAIVLVSAGEFGEAGDVVDAVMGPMVTQGLEQFLGAAQLIGLVCDAAQGEWEGWSDRFESMAERIVASGQVHGDLLCLAEMAGEFAKNQARPAEAERARRLAVTQRTAIES